jgi:hypothetical protein
MFVNACFDILGCVIVYIYKHKLSWWEGNVPQPTQLLLPKTPHRNQGLFSDYYLDNILPGQWNVLRDEAKETFFLRRFILKGQVICHWLRDGRSCFFATRKTGNAASCATTEKTISAGMDC